MDGFFFFLQGKNAGTHEVLPAILGESTKFTHEQVKMSK
jgi:hypothetical protein